MNEKITAGPAIPMPSPMITKMPVPITAPTPSAVRSSAPTARLRCPSSSPVRVSAINRSWSLTANGPVVVLRPPAMRYLPLGLLYEP